MDRTFYLFVLMVLAERGARAENEEHGSITDRGVALDESSMKLEELSFADEPEAEFSHEAHGRELGHSCGCHSGSWIKCSAWGSSQCCRCVGTCTCFGYDPSKVEIHLDLKKDELELQPAVSRGPVLEQL